MSFIFYQQIDIILPVSSGVLSKAHNFFLCLFFYTPSNSESQPTPRLSTKSFFLHPSLIRWMLYIATDYCRLLIKFKQELKALAEAFVRNFFLNFLMTIVLSTYVDLSQRCSKATFLQRLIKVDSDPPNDAFFMISLHILHKAIQFFRST